MDRINKYQTVVILAAAMLGIVFAQNEIIANFSTGLIIPLLMLMLFGLFLSLNISEVQTSFLNSKFLVANIVINFIWTPLFSYALGSVFLSQELAIWIGFVMLMVTPCTDWYLVFTGIAKGNVSLSTSALPINLLLQVLLLPVYLIFFFGESGHIELRSLAESITLVLVLPFLLAFATRKGISGAQKRKLSGYILFLEKSQVLFLALAVTAMFASEGKSLIAHPELISILLTPILIFFVGTFLIAQLAGRALQFNDQDKVSLTLTTMARNSPIALAIAVAAFPEQPLIALSLVIGPLVELPILVLTAQILLKMYYRPKSS